MFSVINHNIERRKNGSNLKEKHIFRVILWESMSFYGFLSEDYCEKLYGKFE